MPRDARAFMGTVFSLAAPEVLVSRPAFFRAWDAASELLRRIEQIYSPFLPDSPVSRVRDGRLRLEDLDRQPDLSALEVAEFREILAVCAYMRRETEGAFDAWSVGDPPMFDPSGVVKGWATERASALLAELGLTTHMLNGGGDVRVRDSEQMTWFVGVTHPDQPKSVIARIAIREGGVATSGIAERGKHVWDPIARRPAESVAQVTVVGPNLTLADGYATAAVALGCKRAVPFLGELGVRSPYQSFMVSAEPVGGEPYGVWWSAGFEDYYPFLRGKMPGRANPDRPD